MSRIIFDSCARALSLAWLTGPVFDKELRVSSRRRRNYVLRGVYVAGFMLLVTLVWIGNVPRGSSGVYQASRMARAGQVIIVAVAWFQFLATQILAVVMLSAAISDEINHRTLGLLMTTPLGSLQLVLGKVLSKLLQMTLLLAISLPMLAIVRVFGGVPWSFLLCGVCLTLTTALFYGSLSLFFSIFTRRAYAVIIRTVLAGGVLFALLPLLAMLVLHRHVSERAIVNVLFHLNPYMGLVSATESLTTGFSPGFAVWPVHCVIALAVSALILALATVFVRKAALRQATGQGGLLSGRPKIDGADGASRGRIRRVVGPPVFWRERRVPLLGPWTISRIIAALAAVVLLASVYVLCLREGVLNSREVQTAYIVIYMLLGTLVTAVLPATCITTERESQTWPILLTTTVSSGAILTGKLLGAFRRCLVAWGLLLGHVLLFSLLGCIHRAAVLQFAILVGWVTMFLCGTGLYFSTRLRHTTGAVVANVALAAGIWAITPGLLGLTVAALRGLGSELLELYMDTNPVVHAIVIAGATTDRGRLARYDWIQAGAKEVGPATTWMLFNFMVYVGVGLAFFARAWARVRFKPV